MRDAYSPLALLSFLILSITVGCVHAPSQSYTTATPESVGLSSTALDQIDDLMRSRVDSGQLAGGAVVVARRGEIVLAQSYGRSNILTGEPFMPDTIVRMYSMSKSIVSAGALMLVEEGAIDLDAPVARYIPAFENARVWTPEGLAKPRRTMTVRDLMRHTAGLHSGADDTPVGRAMAEVKLGEARDLEDLCNRLAKVPLAYHPGERWVYSHSIDVLGLVIEKASGQPLDEFLDQRLLKPLGMGDTAFWVPADKIDRFAACYRRGEHGLELIQGMRFYEQYHQKPATMRGGSGLVGTASDYARFLMMIANEGAWGGKRYLSSRSIRLMTQDQLPPQALPIGIGGDNRDGHGFGLGFRVTTAHADWEPRSTVGEYGWGGLPSCHYWVSPKDGDLIVVTVEQTLPFTFDTEWLLKPVIYGAIMP